MDERIRIKEEPDWHEELPDNTDVQATLPDDKTEIPNNVRRGDLGSISVSPPSSGRGFSFCTVARTPYGGRVRCKVEPVKIVDERSSLSTDPHDTRREETSLATRLHNARGGKRKYDQVAEREEPNGHEPSNPISEDERSDSNGLETTHVDEKVCDVCLARFPTDSQLAAHKRYHTGAKPYASESRFVERRNLDVHRSKHTLERPHVCSTCDARFSTAIYLERHRRTHTGEKPFSCEVCDTRFTTATGLTQHARSHPRERWYDCGECDVACATAGELAVHAARHAGLRPYGCGVCGARFNSASHLARHGRTHTGERPFSCDVCDAKFATHSDVTRHKRIHARQR